MHASGSRAEGNDDLDDQREDTTSIILSKAFLERNGAQPLHVQIRNAVELAIFSGEIPDGAPLPSVRQLSSELNVAPNTVVRAYQDLLRDEWVEASPKRGYFVRIDTDDHLSDSARSYLMSLLDPVIDASRELGVSESTLLQLIAEQIRTHRDPVRKVAVLGNPENLKSGRVEVTREALADLNAEVVGVSYKDLEEYRSSGTLDDIDIFFLPVAERQQARPLLTDELSKIVPVTTRLRTDVQERLASLPPDVRMGAIAGTRENVSRLVGILKQYHPLRVSPITAHVLDEDAVQHVFDNAEFVAISSRALPYIPSTADIPRPWIEAAMVPDEKSIRRLRLRLHSP